MMTYHVRTDAFRAEADTTGLKLSPMGREVGQSASENLGANNRYWYAVNECSMYVIGLGYNRSQPDAEVCSRLRGQLAPTRS
jgi:hypothetical protein